MVLRRKGGGPATFDQALRAVRPGGEIVLVGVLTGFAGQVNTGAIFMNAVDLRGVYVGSAADLTAALGSGIRPVADEIFRRCSNRYRRVSHE